MALAFPLGQARPHLGGQFRQFPPLRPVAIATQRQRRTSCRLAIVPRRGCGFSGRAREARQLVEVTTAKHKGRFDNGWRLRFSGEEKGRIVLEGPRDDQSVAELCRRGGLAPHSTRLIREWVP